MPLVKALIGLDNFLIDNKTLPSYHVYIVCQKTDNAVPMQTKNILPPSAVVFPARDIEALTILPTPKGLISARAKSFRPQFRRAGRHNRVMDELRDEPGSKFTSMLRMAPSSSEAESAGAHTKLASGCATAPDSTYRTFQEALP